MTVSLNAVVHVTGGAVVRILVGPHRHFAVRQQYPYKQCQVGGSQPNNPKAPNNTHSSSRRDKSLFLACSCLAVSSSDEGSDSLVSGSLASRSNGSFAASSKRFFRRGAKADRKSVV